MTHTEWNQQFTALSEALEEDILLLALLCQVLRRNRLPHEVQARCLYRLWDYCGQHLRELQFLAGTLPSQV